jgi:hypothetical protein
MWVDDDDGDDIDVEGGGGGGRGGSLFDDIDNGGAGGADDRCTGITAGVMALRLVSWPQCWLMCSICGCCVMWVVKTSVRSVRKNIFSDTHSGVCSQEHLPRNNIS